MENCGLYIAKVVGTSKNNDNRLQVQIIPHMEGIPTELCPKWPFFFKDELCSGKSGDMVWCICDDNFTIGYILGIANFTTFVSEDFESTYHPYNKSKVSLSLPYSDFEDGESTLQKASIKLKGETLNFSDYKALYWDSTCIHLIDRTSGSFIIAYSSGSLFIMSSSLFAIHIGDADSGSYLKLNSEGFSIKGDSIRLQAPDIGLGENPTGKVLVTNGVDASASYTSSAVEA